MKSLLLILLLFTIGCASIIDGSKKIVSNAYGVLTVIYNYHILPVPGVYLINTRGQIVFNYVHPNYKTRLNESVMLDAAKAFK